MLSRRLRRLPNIEPTVAQCLVFAVMGQQCWADVSTSVTNLHVKTTSRIRGKLWFTRIETRSTNAGLMLGQRRKWWNNNIQASGQCLVIAGVDKLVTELCQCWVQQSPPLTELNRRTTETLLGVFLGTCDDTQLYLWLIIIPATRKFPQH